MRWKPIENAPKWNGEGLPPYVLISDGTYVFVGYRHDPNYPDDPEWCDEGGAFVEPQPTHWQPLPAAPTPPTDGPRK